MHLPHAIQLEWFTHFLLFEPLWPRLGTLGPLIQPPHVTELGQMIDIKPLTFVPQPPKSANFEDGYEARIFLKNQVPTREHSWHDFFNALVWERFFKSKRTINQLHFHLQQSRYPNKQRMPAENMLTLFDENGAIVIASDATLLTLIREHKWHELFWLRREELSQKLKVIVFGHGLYEKALQPYIGLTAQCLLFEAQESTLSYADTLVTEFFTQHKNDLHPSLLAPLPILGIPGWWQNNFEDFYHNKSYFRPYVERARPSRLLGTH